MAVPVFVDGQWWGLIAFDDCQVERHWGVAEIDAFKTLAEMVGAAVARTRHLRTLADANWIIEASPTVLYKLGPQAPFPLTYISQNMRQYGYDANDLLAKPNLWSKLIAGDDLPPLLTNINSLVSGKTSHVPNRVPPKKNPTAPSSGSKAKATHCATLPANSLRSKAF